MYFVRNVWTCSGVLGWTATVTHTDVLDLEKSMELCQYKFLELI